MISKTGKFQPIDCTATFDCIEQGWVGRVGRPYNAGIRGFAEENL